MSATPDQIVYYIRMAFWGSEPYSVNESQVWVERDVVMTRVKQQFAGDVLEVYRSPLEGTGRSMWPDIFLTTNKKSVAFRLADWCRQQKFHAIALTGGIVVQACPLPAAIVRARWVPLLGDIREIDDEVQYPTLCQRCRRPDLDHPPNPYPVSAKILRSPRKEIFRLGGNAVYVVNRRVLEVFSECVAGEFNYGHVRVIGHNECKDRFFWIRPKYWVGGEVIWPEQEPCPECGLPMGADRVVEDGGPFFEPGLLHDFGKPSWNFARVSRLPTTRPGSPCWFNPRLDGIVSGGLFAVLYDSKIKGLFWPRGPYVSAREDEPTVEPQRRFADLFTGKADRIVRARVSRSEWEMYGISGHDCGKVHEPTEEGLGHVISDHIGKTVGKVGTVLHEVIPTGELHVDIHVVEPTAERPFHTLVTSGMSALAMPMPKGVSGNDATPYVELMLCLPRDWRLDELEHPRWNWPVLWMRTLARYPHRFDRWLYVGHTIPNGDPPGPFGPGTDLCCWCLHIPRTVDPAKFCEVKWGKKTVLVLGMTPIYKSEMDWVLREEETNDNARRELDERLAAAGATELLDLKRPPLFFGTKKKRG